MKVVGYGRVSTVDQGENGHSLDAQRQAVAQFCELKGWDMTWTQDVASGKDMKARPGLVDALIELAAGSYGALVVAKLDRVSRSVHDFSELLEASRAEQWSFVALDLSIDTTTATGEMIANLMAVLAQWERKLIGERTRAGQAEAKRKGVKFGRKDYFVHPDTLRQIRRLKEEGKTLGEIAEALNECKRPSPGGKVWVVNTVWREVRRMFPDGMKRRGSR